MVKRYLIGVYGEHQHPSGDFVHWQDYQTICAELEQTKEVYLRAWNERDAQRRRAEAAERLAGARVKELLDFICDDILPSYGIASEVGRNDIDLSASVREFFSKEIV